MQEAPLPHSPRTMTFLNNDSICFAYSPTEHALFSVKTLLATDLTLPASTTASVTGMGAFTGLTGYMTLGLGAKAKPCIITVNDSEALIAKDGMRILTCLKTSKLTITDIGHFVNADGGISRGDRIEWLAPPEDIGESCFCNQFTSSQCRISSCQALHFFYLAPWLSASKPERGSNSFIHTILRCSDSIFYIPRNSTNLGFPLFTLTVRVII